MLVASAVLDCADGQLARMRRTSSSFGRMLDGAVDAIVQAAVLSALAAHVWWRHGGASPGAPFTGDPAPAARGSGSRSGPSRSPPGRCTRPSTTTSRTYTSCTHLTQREGSDDPEEVEARYNERRPSFWQFSDWLRFSLYRRYVPQQRAMLARVDPYIPRRFRAMPGYSVEGRATARSTAASCARGASMASARTSSPSAR
ncbi:MAG: CDP-alcohol phosphatidyltransferase family protein [Polyangiales bacterium]